MGNPTKNEIIEAGKVLYTMPFHMVFKQWFNEAVRASDAYGFIKKKGLLDEYLYEREENALRSAFKITSPKKGGKTASLI